MQRVEPSIPALVLLGLVVVGAGLLIAGFGVAVGVGLLVGMLLGLVAVLAGMAITQRGTPGVTWSSTLSAEPESEQALIQRYGQAAARVAGVDSGDLTGVMVVGQEVDAAGVRVQLLTVELRASGGIATLVAHTKPPVGPPGHFVDVSVSDETGTEYVAAGQLTGSASPSTSRFEIRFAPGPSASALTLRIERFHDPFIGGKAATEGPWEFPIPLAL
jgi:hypothetical protein